MNRIVWTRLDTAIIVAVTILMFVVTGFTVKANEKSGLQAAGQSSDWKCHPNHARGQLACVNVVDGRHTIVATKLSSPSLAQR
jgi:hypothetical protein